MYGALDISTSGMVAQRSAMEVAAGNIASKDAVVVENGEAVPYRRKVPLFAAVQRGPQAGGVKLAKVAEDPTPFGLRFDPHHPHALRGGPQTGYVRTSNVDYTTEMVNAMTAMRAYEANVSVIEMIKTMSAGTLRILV